MKIILRPQDISVFQGRSVGIGEIRINNYDHPYLYRQAEQLRLQILNAQKIQKAIEYRAANPMAMNYLQFEEWAKGLLKL